MSTYNKWWREFEKMSIDEKVGFLFFSCGIIGLISDGIFILQSGPSVIKLILIPVFVYYIKKGAKL